MLGKPTDPRKVLRDLVAGAALVLTLWVAIPRLDWYRVRYDEVTRAQNAVAIHPVNLALRQHKPGDWPPIADEVRTAAAAGATESELLARMRVQHLKLARHYLIYAPAPTVIRYAEALLPALRELQQADPALCVRLAWPAAGPAFDAISHLDPHTAERFEAAIAEVIARSDTGQAVERMTPERVRLADPARACTATLALLERSLQREPAEARRLLANMLRS
jgi:hypothetical protein